MALNGSPAANPAWTGQRWSRNVREVSLGQRRLRFLDLGAGPIILLVHGLGASWQVWYQNIADLSSDHRVVAVDLPGFGASQALPRGSGIGAYADALAALLDHIEADRAVVVGHSLGGLIGARLAATHSRQVSGLVLVGSADGVLDVRSALGFRSAAAFTTVLNRAWPAALVAPPILSRLMTIPVLRRRVIAQVVHDPDAIPAELAALMLVSVLRSPSLSDAIHAGLRADLMGNLSQIECPTTVVCGQQDRMVSELAARRLAAAINGSRFLAWSNVGHHPMLERPDEFNALVRALAVEVRTPPHEGISASPHATSP